MLIRRSRARVYAVGYPGAICGCCSTGVRRGIFVRAITPETRVSSRSTPVRQNFRAVRIVGVESADAGCPVRTDFGAVADIAVIKAIEGRDLDQTGGTHAVGR